MYAKKGKSHDHVFIHIYNNIDAHLPPLVLEFWSEVILNLRFKTQTQ